ncbi:MAG TPA: proline--tRNA ligase [Rhodospirillales bacterium]|nr:proline--tRNA ligase [Rhodospirillales bacterium]HIC59580.1 proline--tRNA ligase [Rhodospirillales bacterium]
MYLSRFLMPTLKENPAEAQIVSHRYMMRSGMIRQSSAGIYSWLPLGLRVLKKIEQIVREEQNFAGCQELLMPTIQPATIWRESGRYEDYGKEMLRITDRHEREMLYGPTNEELITEIFRGSVRTYKDLPKLLYHIQWKFRDEVRPRFGVMRGREFLMKDTYSFDLNFDGAKKTYNKMFVAYLRTFARMGLRAIPMAADSGPIGGDMSHEFLILADTGESEVFCHKDILSFDLPKDNIDYNEDFQPIVDKWTELYAATDEKHNLSQESLLAEDLVSARGIEVGHIFYFGTKYSKAMNALISSPSGQEIPVEMGSYGIGISRLVAGIIEASHDDDGIIWPESVAPFDIGIINLSSGNESCDSACEDLYFRLENAGLDVLYDERDERAGVKFANMDLIGLPWQIIAGPRGIKNGVIELKNRATGEKDEMTLNSVLNKFARI